MVSMMEVVRCLIVLLAVQATISEPCHRRKVREERLIQLLTEGDFQPQLQPALQGEFASHVRPARGLVYQPPQPAYHHQPPQLGCPSQQHRYPQCQPARCPHHCC